MTTFDTLDLQADAMRSTMEDLSRLADNFGVRMIKAFAGAAIHGRKFSDVLKGLALSLSNMALSSALKPVGQLLGGLLANARGNLFSGGGVVPFASGGIVNSPTLFPMRSGVGLMGEAGPEAILPLARGRDGKLGVRGGGGTHVIVNISTPDAESFKRSQGQISATLARAVARGQRNL